MGERRVDAHEPGAVLLDVYDTALPRVYGYLRSQAVLDRLGPHHRAALTLRYLDDLPVTQVAALLDRTLHATEALLVRARAAFRQAYLDTGEDNDGD